MTATSTSLMTEITKANSNLSDAQNAARLNDSTDRAFGAQLDRDVEAAKAGVNAAIVAFTASLTTK